MNKLRNRSGFWGLWKLVGIFAIFGYLISNVLAFDTNGKKLLKEQKPESETINSPSLHKQIEGNVAHGAKKVWTNLVGFMQEDIPSKSKNPKNKESKQAPWEPNFPIVRTPLAQSESALLPSFTDISWDANRESIEALASIGIFQWGETGKFNPGNHVRNSDFIRVLVDIYRHKNGYQLETKAWLSSHEQLPWRNYDPTLSAKINTAKEQEMLEGLGDINFDALITPNQAKMIINNLLNRNSYIGDRKQIQIIDTTKSVLTKTEMAHYLVEIFHVEKAIKDSMFSDIGDHKYNQAITRLAQLGVVAGKNGNFYPENYVLRADWVVMIANSILIDNAEALIIHSFSHLNNINDTTYFAAYAPHLEYLLDHEIGNNLLYPEQSGYLFLPNAMLTKWEAYTLIAQAAWIKLLSTESRDPSQPITRGELAKLITEAFDFTPKTSYKKEVENLKEKEKKENLLTSVLKKIVDEL